MERVRMGKSTKRTKPKHERQEDISTVDLKGDAIEVVGDYSRFIALEEDPLRVEDANGVDLEKAKPDWHFAWVRNGQDGRASQINMRKMQGYEIVTDSDVIAPAQDPDERKKRGGQIVINELTLMRCPMKLHRQREEYFRQENERRMAGLKRELDREVGGDAYGEVEIRQGGYA
jgi:hypothetical protein